ncbi:MAG: type I-U CRISPR-associated protein Csx17, partial [Pseudonocardia sp.]|nr:type I-U CRISPR-associated protein Csx17 [Pseudonocardia sp.]
GFVNPWTFLLTIEGALLFATAVVRRHGTDYQQSPGWPRSALPFQVRGSVAGYDTAAAGEAPLGELWTPEWDRPVGIAELEHLFGEGRAEWGGSPARSGLDFARAVASLGVDRGLTAFERHIFVDRLGQNPLAVPGGRIEVVERAGVGALAALDPWLARLRWDRAPSAVQAGVREVEAALFEHARTGGGQRLVAVLESVGRCHAAVARSGAARERVRPLVLPEGRTLMGLLHPAATTDDMELRIALAVATAREESGERFVSLREFLTPIRREKGRPEWSKRPDGVGLAAGLAAALADAARRRAFPGATPEVRGEEIAVRGSRIAFDRGVRLGGGDVTALARRTLDEGRCADLVSGLLCVRWGSADHVLDSGGADRDPAVDLILPFTGVEPVRVPNELGWRQVLLRPDPAWPLKLLAGDVASVLQEAARRLRISGFRFVIDPGDRAPDADLGAALAALLVVPIDRSLRLPALRRVAVLPDVQSRLDKETA